MGIHLSQIKTSRWIFVFLCFIFTLNSVLIFRYGVLQKPPTLEDHFIKYIQLRAKGIVAPIPSIDRICLKTVNRAEPTNLTTKVLPLKTSHKSKPTEKLKSRELESKPSNPQPLPLHVKAPHELYLAKGVSTSVVHYVWCGRRWFEFNHYLSVRSVIREFRPDLIMFHYDTLPVFDYFRYNTWFHELTVEFPFLLRMPMSESDRGCKSFAQADIQFIYNKLRVHGGIYVNEHTILTDFSVDLRRKIVVWGLDDKSLHGYLMTRRGYPEIGIDPGDYVANTDFSSASFMCDYLTKNLTISKSSKTSKTNCLNIPNQIFPKDFWELDSKVGRLIRSIFYGAPDLPVVRQSPDDLSPNIAHIVWLGGGRMDFLFYLCVLSLLHVAKVDAVYIHGESPPSGAYWKRLAGESRLYHVDRESSRAVYNQPVKVLSHMTDVWRVDFMIKYGGIYVDTDTVFVRPLDDHIRSYDAVGSYDWTYWNAPFPDTINFGVAVGRRNASFWHQFQQSMRWFIDDDWAWNGLRQPYRIKERHPELVKIDPHLQVICFEMKCHPTWLPDYHNQSVHHLNTARFDWRRDVYAVHWTLPTPPELTSEQKLMQSNTMFADIGRFILQKAGVV